MNTRPRRYALPLALALTLALSGTAPVGAQQSGAAPAVQGTPLELEALRLEAGEPQQIVQQDLESATGLVDAPQEAGARCGVGGCAAQHRA